MTCVLYMEVSLFKGFSNNQFKRTNRSTQVVEQDGYMSQYEQQQKLLPMVCGLPRQLGPTKILYMFLVWITYFD